MKNKHQNSEGISDIVSIVLIIALMVILAMIVYALLFGSLSLKQTSRVAATAGTVKVPIDSTTSIPIIYAQPSAGDKYYLIGQTNIPSGYPVAFFTLRDPLGTGYQTTQTITSSNANQFGTPLFIYRDDYGYHVTNSGEMIVFNRTNLKPFYPQGEWTITMYDNVANVPLTEMKVRIGGDNPLFNPLGGSMSWTNSGFFINKTGFMVPFTNYNVGNFTGPGGLKAYSFNGVNSYIQGADNPDVTFTGDMGLSFWLQPTATGTNGYHEILGKGSSGDVNDNYDLFIINQRLWFEWTDRNTGQMYHIMTNNPVAWGSPPNWNYVTVNVNSGTPSIYFAGNPQAISYYQGNTLGTPAIAPVTVNLKADNNPITIGKQNYVGNEMYYAGNMSEVTYYNRALSSSEITNNQATYQT
jgi:hypothetical protein